MNILRLHIFLCLVGALGGCAGSAITEQARELALPQAWQRGAAPGAFAPDALARFQTPGLDGLVAQALARNRALAQQRSRVEAARQGVAVSRAARLPGLNLGAGAERSRAAAGAALGQRFNLSASLAFELDAWGRLSDAQRQAVLGLKAEEARYASLERRIAADVLAGAFQVVAANQLLALFRQRLENLTESMGLIERSYRGGLSDALDVYLAQTTVDQERANVVDGTVYAVGFRGVAHDVLRTLDLATGQTTQIAELHAASNSSFRSVAVARLGETLQAAAGGNLCTVKAHALAGD